MAIEKIDYSCKDAFTLLTIKDAKEARKKLMVIYGCTTLQQFYQRRKKYTNIPAHIKDKVEEMFNSYGVPKNLVWKITRK
ncbi:MAG: hypothetical protein MJZ00_07120 [Paludibacteraceae bacterium]|nr:hypothetical protein [Paludibacteraceae bacterium]